MSDGELHVSKGTVGWSHMTTRGYVQLLDHEEIPYMHCRCDYDHFSSLSSQQFELLTFLLRYSI